jgi:hypothetical protein
VAAAKAAKARQQAAQNAYCAAVQAAQIAQHETAMSRAQHAKSLMAADAQMGMPDDNNAARDAAAYDALRQSEVALVNAQAAQHAAQIAQHEAQMAASQHQNSLMAADALAGMPDDNNAARDAALQQALEAQGHDEIALVNLQAAQAAAQHAIDNAAQQVRVAGQQSPVLYNQPPAPQQPDWQKSFSLAPAKPASIPANAAQSPGAKTNIAAFGTLGGLELAFDGGLTIPGAASAPIAAETTGIGVGAAIGAIGTAIGAILASPVIVPIVGIGLGVAAIGALLFSAPAAQPQITHTGIPWAPQPAITLTGFPFTDPRYNPLQGFPLTPIKPIVVTGIPFASPDYASNLMNMAKEGGRSLSPDEQQQVGRIDSIPDWLAKHPDLADDAKVVNNGGNLATGRDHVREAQEQIQMLQKAINTLQSARRSLDSDTQSKTDEAITTARQHIRDLQNILSTK